jgi:hypothetical protein
MSYPTTPLKTFADVQNLLDAFINSANAITPNTIPIGNAPHDKFWRTNILTGQPMTWEAFTTGVLPLNAQYATAMQWPTGDANSPLIVVVGKPDQSPIINMLSASGDYYVNGPGGSVAGQMPQDSPPYEAPPQDPPQSLVIQLLSDWIKNGCPNGRHSLVRREED